MTVSLPFIPPAAALGPGASVENVSSAKTGVLSGVTSATFTSMALGTAETGRKILVAVMWHRGGTNATVSSLTVGGNTASPVAGEGASGGAATDRRIEFWQINNYNSGTTGDIVVTLSGGTNFILMGVSVYKCMGLADSATQASGAQSNTNTVAVSNVDSVAGRVAIAACFMTASNLGSANAAWSGTLGVVEDMEMGDVGNVTGRATTASVISTTTDTNRTVQCVMSGSTSYNSVILVVTFGAA